VKPWVVLEGRHRDERTASAARSPTDWSQSVTLLSSKVFRIDNLELVDQSSASWTLVEKAGLQWQEGPDDARQAVVSVRQGTAGVHKVHEAGGA
jgi:hypothetical protein